LEVDLSVGFTPCAHFRVIHLKTFNADLSVRERNRHLRNGGSRQCDPWCTGFRSSRRDDEVVKTGLGKLDIQSKLVGNVDAIISLNVDRSRSKLKAKSVAQISGDGRCLETGNCKASGRTERLD